MFLHADPFEYCETIVCLLAFRSINKIDYSDATQRQILFGIVFDAFFGGQESLEYVSNGDE